MPVKKQQKKPKKKPKKYRLRGESHDMGARNVTLVRSSKDAPRSAQLLSESGYRKVVIERIRGR